MEPWVIAIIVASILLLVIVLIIGAIIFNKRRKRNRIGNDIPIEPILPSLDLLPPNFVTARNFGSGEDDGDDGSGVGSFGDDDSGEGSFGDDDSGEGSFGDDDSGEGSFGDDRFAAPNGVNVPTAENLFSGSSR